MDNIRVNKQPSFTRTRIILLGVLIFMTQCSGPGYEIYGPLPTTDKESPILPGCKQLRAEGGEC